MSKLRVYMVAKDLGMDNKSLVGLFQAIGVADVKNHMSAVSPEQVERAKRQLAKQSDDRVVESRVTPPGTAGSVIIRRGKRPNDPVPVEPTPPVRRGGSGGHERSSRATHDSVEHDRAPVAEPALAPEAVYAAPEPTFEPRVEVPRAAEPMPAPEPVREAASVRAASEAHEHVRPEPTVSVSEPVAPSAVESHAAPKAAAPVEAVASTTSANSGAAAAIRSAAPEESPKAPSAGASPNGIMSSAVASEATESRKPALAEPAKGEMAERPAPTEPQRPRVEAAAVAAPAPVAVAAPVAAAPDVSAHRTPPVRGRDVRPAPSTPVRTDNPPPRPSSPPKTGIDVWQGRPGVPMPQPPRGAVPRRVQYDAKVGTGPGARRGPPQGGPVNSGPPGLRNNPNMRGGGGPGGRRGNFGMITSRRSGPQSIVTQERSAHKKVVKMEQDISLQTLAARMGVKAGEVLMKLMSLGVIGVNINSTLDSDTAKIVAEEFGWTVEDVAVSEDAAIAAAQGAETEEDKSEREPRPPVVTVMGHVDHGKTSLLDKIRRSTVAAGEAGGITQHIGAYSVKTPKGRITFMDTPGHAAFTQMRARGAKATDLIVLVVAADDGVMPQTKEAIAHARDARCPMVVAVNKIDKPDAQPERVRRELSDVGLMPEEWGGHTLFVEVSAQTGQGIDTLLDSILLQAEMLDLGANPKRHARGTVIEAKLDRGRGPVATILVTDGTLRKGDGLLVGNSWGKVRAMLDDSGRNISEAGPSTPVSVIGLSEVPSAGDMVDAVQDAKKAQQIAEQRRDKLAERVRGATSKVSLEELARRMSQNDQKELKVIVKGDVQGTVEALNEALEKMSTEKVRVNVVHYGVGAITEGDVNLAVAARALIIGFNVRPAGKASTLAQKEGIEIRQYSIIYDVTDDVKASMEGLLAPTLVEEPIGEAEVRKIFKVTKAGVVAGCMVIHGVVRRNSMVRLRRDKEIIWEGRLESLKRFKDDAKEVREGFDCGISFAGYSNLQEGDIISAFEMKEVRPTL